MAVLTTQMKKILHTGLHSRDEKKFKLSCGAYVDGCGLFFRTINEFYRYSRSKQNENVILFGSSAD